MPTVKGLLIQPKRGLRVPRHHHVPGHPGGGPASGWIRPRWAVTCSTRNAKAAIRRDVRRLSATRPALGSADGRAHTALHQEGQVEAEEAIRCRIRPSG
jgi:hypothetical protein